MGWLRKHNTIDLLTRTVSVWPCVEIQHDWHTYKNRIGSTMCGNTTRLTHLQEPYRFDHVLKYNAIDTFIRTVSIRPCVEIQQDWQTYKSCISSTMCGNTAWFTHLQETYRFDHVRKYNMIDTLTRTVSVRSCAETQHDWHTYKNRISSTMCENTTWLTHLQEPYRFDHVRKHNTIDTLTRAVSVKPCAETQHHWHTYKKHNTIDALTRAIGSGWTMCGF